MVWWLAACHGVEPAVVVANEPPIAAVRPASAPQPASPRCGAGVPTAACTVAGVRVCGPSDRDRIGAWRYALVAGPFEPTQDVTADQLRAAWRAGTIAAAPDTEAVLGAGLGVRATPARLAVDEHPVLDATHWAIVPAHELVPGGSVVTVGGKHPLVDGDGPLVVPLCGEAKPIHNIDRDHLTTLVMSGTTAMTGRTAERIDRQGVADTIRYIQPFFAGADLVHISNEVAFVRRCHPSTGQQTLVFCARDAYISLLEGLHTNLVELTGNHLVDYGQRSLQRTIDMYEQRGWAWFGGGRTQIDATTPRLVEDHGNRLAFVGCNAVNWWIHAISPGPGVASCDWARMAWQIQDLRRRGYIPIATVQHRELRTHAPPPDLVHDLRGLAEAGAAFVLGSQAHVAHPWDVHHGAYVHYGPGNILFAQYREVQREATVDKLYLYEGRLLTVAHLYTRTEHGQPRLLTDPERVAFLGELEAAAATLAPPEPWARPVIPATSRVRPDAVVVRGRSQPLTVTAPEHVAAGARYPLVVDLTAAAAPVANAFVVARAGKPVATGAEIARFMRKKYPIDGDAVSIVPAAHHASGGGKALARVAKSAP
jgi:poly-gamma-glutamate capsule biosynthesis protein CapA/YwtB (metallophosphatase superfamily)